MVIWRIGRCLRAAAFSSVWQLRALAHLARSSIQTHFRRAGFPPPDGEDSRASLFALGGLVSAQRLHWDIFNLKLCVWVAEDYGSDHATERHHPKDKEKGRKPCGSLWPSPADAPRPQTAWQWRRDCRTSSEAWMRTHDSTPRLAAPRPSQHEARESANAAKVRDQKEPCCAKIWREIASCGLRAAPSVSILSSVSQWITRPSIWIQSKRKRTRNQGHRALQARVK
eukprot:scaffold733_cov267-Pinguiococcus_pyrenoidosus.AAC.8